MNTSFYNGVSGIKSHQYGIDNLSDNIANVNTVGYKGSTTEFSTIFSTTLDQSYSTPALSDIGLGSSVSTTSLDLSQGSLIDTDNTFDLAIGGEGWFGVGSLTNRYFTRSGEFSIDANGDLVDAGGNYLLGTSGNNITPTSLDQAKLDEFGKSYTSSGTSLTDAYAISAVKDIPLGDVNTQTKINLPDFLYYPPVPTQNITYKANLNPEIRTEYDPNSGQDVEIPNIEHFTTSIISPNGDDELVDMTFTKRVPQQTEGSTWDADAKILKYYEDFKIEQYDPTKTYDTSIYNIDTTKNQVTKIYDPTMYQVDYETNKVYQILDEKSGVLEFGGSGELLSNTMPALSNDGTPLNLNLGTPYSSTNSGFDGLTSSQNISQNRVVTGDGVPDGMLTNYDIDQNGNIIANFTNGKSSAIAKVGIYHFQNDGGLQKIGSSLFSASENSGKAIFYQDSNGENILGSSIYSNKLEESNVNLSTALTELIVLQKAYNANASTITTSDQMIQNAINMKK